MNRLKKLYNKINSETNEWNFFLYINDLFNLIDGDTDFSFIIKEETLMAQNIYSKSKKIEYKTTKNIADVIRNINNSFFKKSQNLNLISDINQTLINGSDNSISNVEFLFDIAKKLCERIYNSDFSKSIEKFYSLYDNGTPHIKFANLLDNYNKINTDLYNLRNNSIAGSFEAIKSVNKAIKQLGYKSNIKTAEDLELLMKNFPSSPEMYDIKNNVIKKRNIFKMNDYKLHTSRLYNFLINEKNENTIIYDKNNFFFTTQCEMENNWYIKKKTNNEWFVSGKHMHDLITKKINGVSREDKNNIKKIMSGKLKISPDIIDDLFFYKNALYSLHINKIKIT